MGRISELVSRAQQTQAQREAQYVSDSARQPIPGLTGPVSSGAGIPGMPTAQPPMAAQPFATQGPYGQQALQLAGLLGRSQIPAQPTGPRAQGLIGGPIKGFRIPGGPYGR